MNTMIDLVKIQPQTLARASLWRNRNESVQWISLMSTSNPYILNVSTPVKIIIRIRTSQAHRIMRMRMVRKRLVILHSLQTRMVVRLTLMEQSVMLSTTVVAIIVLLLAFPLQLHPLHSHRLLHTLVLELVSTSLHLPMNSSLHPNPKIPPTSN